MPRLSLVIALVLGACADTPDAPPPVADAPACDVAVPADSGAMAPRLAAGADGPVLSWVEPTDRGHALRFARWTGDGWSGAETADEGDDWFVNWADTPGVVPGPDGKLLAHTLTRHPSGESPYAYDVSIRQSGGDSALLHTDGVAAEHGFVSAVSLDDGVGLVWLDGRNQGGGHGHGGGSMTLRYARLTPDGTRRDEAELDARTCDCCPTDLVTTPSGLVAAYRDRSPDEIRDVAIVRLVDGVWTEPVIPHADGWQIAGCPVNGPALSARGDYVALAWFTAADSAQVRVAISEDGGETWGPAVRIDSGTPIGRVDVDVLDGDEVIVSWLEGVDEDTAEVRVRRLADGALRPSQTVEIVASGRASGFPRVVTLGNRALVAWTDVDAATVRSAVVTL